MRSLELNIFIDCKKERLYDHLSEPINMIGLQPLLTEIDVLKERMDENNVSTRPFYMVETIRWLGFPIFRNKIYSVIRLTKPKDELEIQVYSNLKTEIVFKYSFKEFNDQRTQITQTVKFMHVTCFLKVLCSPGQSMPKERCSQI